METEVLRVEPLAEPVNAVVYPPGSKSFTNRALITAALASGGVSRLGGPLEADDTAVMRRCLRELGVLVDDADDPWLVLGTGGRLNVPDKTLYAGASGTTARFITALAGLVPGEAVIDGTERMRQRPIGELLRAMETLGVDVLGGSDYPPVRLRGGGFTGGRVEVNVGRSSQFASALMLVAPMARSTVELRMVGDVVSKPYIQNTVAVMEAFGAVVHERADGFDIEPTGYSTAHYEIEVDASAAAYPFVAAAITGGSIKVMGLGAASNQADVVIVDILETMGCVATRDESWIGLSGPGTLQPVDVDMREAPDAALALAVACLFADGRSAIRNIGNLRLKETDRLSALAAELNRVGARAEVSGDDLLIEPAELRSATIETYDDHRMAMSFSLVGLKQPGIEILDPGCVSKTWPGYFEMLESL